MKVVIESNRADVNYWLDLWRYRELFVILAWRDVVVRYKQSIAGIAWAIAQPLMSMVVMTVIFGKVAGLPSQSGAPYAIMVMAAMLPWQFFSNAVSSASQSLVANSNLISKVYFPRLVIPLGSLVVSLVDFMVSFLILALLLVWYSFTPSWRFFLLPVLVIMAFVAALGPSLIFTAMMVRYRDVRIVLPFIVQFGLYISPVAYSSQFIEQKIGSDWYMLYSMNPMVGVIDGFRWAILGGEVDLNLLGISLSILTSATLLCLGIWYFRKTERMFADVI